MLQPTHQKGKLMGFLMFLSQFFLHAFMSREDEESFDPEKSREVYPDDPAEKWAMEHPEPNLQSAAL
jgi:hypothetical protein